MPKEKIRQWTIIITLSATTMAANNREFTFKAVLVNAHAHILVFIVGLAGTVLVRCAYAKLYAIEHMSLYVCVAYIWTMNNCRVQVGLRRHRRCGCCCCSSFGRCSATNLYKHDWHSRQLKHYHFVHRHSTLSALSTSQLAEYVHIRAW